MCRWRLLISCLLLLLPQAGSRWSAAGGAAASDWCYQQLRKHLPAINKAGQDTQLGLGLRQQLQGLQLQVLQGSLAMAARQGHQVRCASELGCFEAGKQTVVQASA